MVKDKPAPLATLQNAKFVPPQSDLNFNDTCPVRVSVQYKAPSLQTRVTLKLFCNYQGKKQDLSCKVDANERDGVAKAELRLFYPDGYKDGTVEYFFTAEHCRGEKVVESDKLKIPKIKQIKKGDKGPIVEEINIRLAGFGGGVPSDTFDDKTEAKVMQFQSDYMKTGAPSGIVDVETATRIDEFAKQFPIDFASLECPCGNCGGFGKDRNKGTYKKFDKIDEELKSTSKNESYHWYEYPGIHRSVLWAIKGAMYYYAQKSNPDLSIRISSGYRCNDNMEAKKRYTCNHLGKAVDLHVCEKKDGKWFRQSGQDVVNGKRSDELRLHLESKAEAVLEWKQANHFSLEGSSLAKTWAHIDCRMFDEVYLKDSLFCKTSTDLEGESLNQLVTKE
jgi:hypothetical protein